MPGRGYWIGIKRDEKDHNVWKRISDEVPVELDGWATINGGYPLDYRGWNFIRWDGDRHTIQNEPNNPWNFICEY